MVQPRKRQARDPDPGGVPDQERALSIRDHVVPLIRALAGAHHAGGLPVLMAVLGPFTLSYRRPLVGQEGKRHRLEIRRRRRLMVLEWSDAKVSLVAFHPGRWEQEVLRLGPARH